MALFALNVATVSDLFPFPAAPHVAGVVALYLEQDPSFSVDFIKNKVVGQSIAGRLSDIGAGSPNLLLNKENLFGESPLNKTTISAADTTGISNILFCVLLILSSLKMFGFCGLL